MKSVFSAVTVLFIVLSLLLFATAVSAQEDEFKVVFLMAESPQDHGWNNAHWRGIQELKTLGELIEETDTGFVIKLPDERLLDVSTIQNVGYNETDIKRVAENVSRTANMVFGTWYNSARPLAELAEVFPNVLFEHCSGYPLIKSNGRNLSTYFIRQEQGDYVSGVAAARMGFRKAGLVGTFPIPEPVRAINGFILGMQSVYPEATVRVVWINSWLDQQKEYDAAKALSAEGFELIRALADTPYSEQAACDDNKVAIGYGSDAEPYAPCTAITNEWNWGVYYVESVSSALNGTWQSRDWWGGFDVDAIKIVGKAAPYVQDIIAKFKDGTLNPWCNLSGSIQVNGELTSIKVDGCLSDMDQLTWQWYVNGYEGEYPDNAEFPAYGK